MAKISKIEAQKRPGRYNIYLDGKYAFAVAESVLIKYRLMKGMELDQAQLAQISNDDEIAKTYNKMLDYLAHQLRTEHDVYEKMRQLKTPAEDIEPVMQKLRGLHLLDDHEYAASYVRTVMNTELKGPQVIRQKLRQKQIGELDIDSALAQFTPERQLANATKLAKKLFKRYNKLSARRQAEKVRQGLTLRRRSLILSRKTNCWPKKRQRLGGAMRNARRRIMKDGLKLSRLCIERGLTWMRLSIG